MPTYLLVSFSAYVAANGKALEVVKSLNSSYDTAHDFMRIVELRYRYMHDPPCGLVWVICVKVTLLIAKAVTAVSSSFYCYWYPTCVVLTGALASLWQPISSIFL